MYVLYRMSGSIPRRLAGDHGLVFQELLLFPAAGGGVRGLSDLEPSRGAQCQHHGRDLGDFRCADALRGHRGPSDVPGGWRIEQGPAAVAVQRGREPFRAALLSEPGAGGRKAAGYHGDHALQPPLGAGFQWISRPFHSFGPRPGQVEQLRLDFESLPCRISTVDSFQGQEADVVLISLVRSNKQGTVGFLSDFRRLNVAVTRARKQVMIVGDASTICKDQVLSSLYDAWIWHK